MGILFMIIPMFIIMYFLIIRPQRVQQKKQRDMLSEIKTGDSVITAGGIYGLISNVKEDRVSLKIADNVKIELSKSSIATVVNKKGEAQKA